MAPGAVEIAAMYRKGVIKFSYSMLYEIDMLRARLLKAQMEAAHWKWLALSGVLGMAVAGFIGGWLAAAIVKGGC